MIKIFTLPMLLIFFVGCSSNYHTPDQNIVNKFNISSGQLLLVVKVNSVEYTDYSRHSCHDENCIVMRTWFIYDAEVLDVLSGSYDGDTISFANMQHTYYVDSVMQEWYVLLEKFNEQSTVSKLRSNYYAAQHEFKL